MEVDIVRVEEPKEGGVGESLDEMWSYVGKKAQSQVVMASYRPQNWADTS